MGHKTKTQQDYVSSAKRVRRGGFWAILGRGGTAFFGFITSALMARLLSPEEFGVYILAFSLVTLGAIVGQVGLDRTVIKLIASAMAKGDLSRSKNIIDVVLIWGGFTSLAVAVILYFGIGEWVVKDILNASTLVVSLNWISLWIVVLIIETLIANIFRGFHNIKLTVTFSGLARGAFLSLVLVYIWINDEKSNLPEIIAYTALAGLVSSIIGFTLLRYKVQDYKSDNKNISRQIFVNASPMLVHAILLYIVTQANIWILGAFRPNDDVALYGAAMRLVLLVGISTSIVNAVVPPLIAEKYAQDNIKSVEGLLRSAATVCGAPALVILIVYIFAGEWVLSVVFGEFYTQATWVLIILSVAEIVNVLTGACSVSLNMTGHQVQMMLLTVARAIVSVIGSVVVVERYGVLGVSVVYGVSLIIYNLSSLLLTRKLVGIWTHVGLSKVKDVFIR